jgi:hypothetical protein
VHVSEITLGSKDKYPAMLATPLLLCSAIRRQAKCSSLPSPKKGPSTRSSSDTTRSAMGRAPCCEKMGLKKGPWTPEEDQILSAHIQRHGHSNWRALPKQAGLLRCGKSCRLRWINYLRPDLKRGNFTREEEDTIIQLHDLLGNRYGSLLIYFLNKTTYCSCIPPVVSFFHEIGAMIVASNGKTKRNGQFLLSTVHYPHGAPPPRGRRIRKKR